MQIMKVSVFNTLLLFTAVVFSSAANADTRTVEVWQCTVRDGKTIEDVHKANTAWRTFMNGKVKGGDIQSFVLTSVVGGAPGFMFVDSYPSLAVWAEVKAILKTPEGQVVDAPILATTDCPSNTLHESTES
jgi:hypothetical protein